MGIKMWPPHPDLRDLIGCLLLALEWALACQIVEACPARKIAYAFAMQAHRVETTLLEDGVITLRGAPFRRGESVEVIVLPFDAANASAARYPLGGTPFELPAPTESAGIKHALQMERRSEICGKFISGEWGVELSGFEDAKTADKLKSTHHADTWRD